MGHGNGSGKGDFVFVSDGEEEKAIWIDSTLRLNPFSLLEWRMEKGNLLLSKCPSGHG